MSRDNMCSKMLVRGTSVPTESHKTRKSEKSRKVRFSDNLSERGGQISSVPKFCSVLQLADEIAAVRNTQGSSRSLPDESKYKYLNFSPDEVIYQDLVGVDIPVKEDIISEIKSEPFVRVREDPELCIKKYTKCDLECGYVFTHTEPTVGKRKVRLDLQSDYNKMTLWRKFI